MYGKEFQDLGPTTENAAFWKVHVAGAKTTMTGHVYM